jgi:uncharacterized delta-60 repeat protein
MGGRMKIQLAMLGLSLAVALIACPSNQEQKPTPIETGAGASKTILGLLEVSLDGLGEGGTPTASARFVNPQAFGSRLGTQAVTSYPYYTDTNLAFIRRQVSFVDFNDSAATADINTTGATRYLSATFTLVNNTATNFNNLIFHAVSLPGTTIGGTGFSTVQRGDGTLETSPAVVQKILPTAGMGLTQTGVAPISGLGDLQWLIQNFAEGATVESQAAAFVPPLNVLALDYGFVARNSSGGRPLSTGGSRGQVTFSYKLPKINPRNANPFGFVIYYVVTNQTLTYASQAVEEHGDTFLNNSLAFITDGVRVVPGSRLLYREDLTSMSNSNNCDSDTDIRVARPDAIVANNVYYPFPEKLGGINEPDCFFGASGRRAVTLGSNDTVAAVASFGSSFYVAGTTSTNGNDFAVWKVNSAGKSDTSFDTDGKVEIDFAAGSNDQAFAIVVDSSGKVIVAGVSNNDFAVIRLNTNGTLDNTFDTDGKFTVNTGSVDTAYGVTIDGGGRIVAAGSSFIGSSADFSLIRLNPGGTLDTSFSTDGIASDTFGSNDIGTSVAIDGNGRIVVGGYTDINNATTGPNDMGVMRFLATGALDTTFSGDGRQTIDFSNDDRAWSVAVYPNTDVTNGGKVVLAGQWAGFAPDYAVARLDSSGNLDTTFSGDGKFNTTFGAPTFGGAEFARSVLIDAAGKLYVGGYTDAGASPDNFGLIRLDGVGALDTTFSGDGKEIYDMNATDDEAYGMAINTNFDLGIAGTSVSASSDFQMIVIEE